MAFPLPRGLTPSEISFLSEMEMVTVIPRQRLEKLDLLGGTTEPLIPPRRATLPLWLALLLKRQRRANILPPAWLNTDTLSFVLELETGTDDNHNDDDRGLLRGNNNNNTDTNNTSIHNATFSLPPPLSPDHNDDDDDDNNNNHGDSLRTEFTYEGKKFYTAPPFAQNHVARDNPDEDTHPPPSLPYHWLEVATMLLDAAGDDIPDADQVRMLLRDLREVRLTKMRHKVEALNTTAIDGGEGLVLTGAGAMEIGESRAFMSGVAEVMRQIGASKEESLREKEVEEAAERDYDEDEDDDML